MTAARRGAGGSARTSDPQAIEINGWSLFAHPLFLDQLESLTGAVEAEAARGKRDTANMKVLRGIHRFAFAEIPGDPSDARFRLGNTMGPEYRHWFRAKFGNGRFRLFYRFHSRARIIVLAWVNDGEAGGRLT
jgi:toxin YhaV